eukprot:jgi/Psemu1/54535/gm1.54535_g
MPKDRQQQITKGFKIRKSFDGIYYDGAVLSDKTKDVRDSNDELVAVWDVEYEDGDREQLTFEELMEWNVSESVATAAVAITTERSSRGRVRKVVSYNESNVDDTGDEGFDDFSSVGSENTIADDDLFGVSSERQSRKRKHKSEENEDRIPAAKKKVKMSDAYNPINNPQNFRRTYDEVAETEEFFDPCGVEAHDDIIEGLMKEQFLKLGKLWKRRTKEMKQKRNERDRKQSRNVSDVIRLMTACSGTDAPALALQMFEEIAAQHSIEFRQNHLMSCEIEPQRCYLFIWRNNKGDVEDDLGDYFECLVNHLKSPAKHSLESFLLAEDHDIVRVFREALLSGPGRYAAMAASMVVDFWASENKRDLKHHKIVRENSGFDDLTRFTTNWGPKNKFQVPPHYWYEYMLTQTYPHQTKSNIDIHAMSAMRDAEAHDSNFSSYFWNITQNPTRERHRGSKSGVAGCITPGGEMKTRCNEGNYEGNLARDIIEATKDVVLKNCSILGESVVETDPSFEPPKGDNSISIFKELSCMSEEAYSAAILCTCESSERIAKPSSGKFVQCKGCAVTICANCVIYHNLSSHEMTEIKFPTGTRFDPNQFRKKLLRVLPAQLYIPTKSVNRICDIQNDKYGAKGLDKFIFSRTLLKRDRQRWKAIYTAKMNHGMGGNIAQLVLNLGALELEESDVRWEICQGERIVTCSLVGRAPVNSTRIKMGISRDVEKTLKTTSQTKYRVRDIEQYGELGRRRWCYPPGWEEWPSEIHVCNVSEKINGLYMKLSCLQTTPHSALWRKQSSNGEGSLYIVLKPNVSRMGPDVGVITSSPNVHDNIHFKTASRKYVTQTRFRVISESRAYLGRTPLVYCVRCYRDSPLITTGYGKQKVTKKKKPPLFTARRRKKTGVIVSPGLLNHISHDFASSLFIRKSRKKLEDATQQLGLTSTCNGPQSSDGALPEVLDNQVMYDPSVEPIGRALIGRELTNIEDDNDS